MIVEADSPKALEQLDKLKKDVTLGMHVTQALKERFTLRASKGNLSLPNLLEFYISLDEKYDFLDADWQKRVLDSHKSDLKDDIFAHAQKLGIAEIIKMEAKKADQVFRVQFEFIKQYLKTLPESERRQWLEQHMQKITDSKTVVQALTNQQLIKLNGRPKLMQVDGDRPLVADINKELLVNCDNGWHIKGQECECPYANTCQYAKGRRYRNQYYKDHKTIITIDEALKIVNEM